MATLNLKQQTFVEEYLVDLNGTQAAVRAGLEWTQLPAGIYYTYFLIDPRDGRIFYVGKGKGKRIKSHARNAIAGAIDNPEKCRRILSIHQSGQNVVEVVFSTHEKEMHAYAAERYLISAFRRHGLTNSTSGTTSARELRKLKCEMALSRLKPYENWLAGASMEQLIAATQLAGSPRACYLRIYQGLLIAMRDARC